MSETEKNPPEVVIAVSPDGKYACATRSWDDTVALATAKWGGNSLVHRIPVEELQEALAALNVRTCVACGRPLLPVEFCTSLRLETGVRYSDNLWALDGRAGTLRRGWACRHTCLEPVEIEHTPEALAEWTEADNKAEKALLDRPLRTSTEDDR